METISKGKAGQIGEIRTWAGKKYQKTAKGWRPVAGGSNKGVKTPESEKGAPAGGKKVELPRSYKEFLDGKMFLSLEPDGMEFGKKGSKDDEDERYLAIWDKKAIEDMLTLYRDRNPNKTVRYAHSPNQFTLYKYNKKKNAVTAKEYHNDSLDEEYDISGSLLDKALSYCGSSQIGEGSSYYHRDDATIKAMGTFLGMGDNPKMANYKAAMMGILMGGGAPFIYRKVMEDMPGYMAQVKGDDEASESLSIINSALKRALKDDLKTTEKMEKDMQLLRSKGWGFSSHDGVMSKNVGKNCSARVSLVNSYKDGSYPFSLKVGNQDWRMAGSISDIIDAVSLLDKMS